MRSELEQLLSLGPLTSEFAPDVALLEQQENLVLALTAPATDEEARAAMALFGADGCFGLAWAVLHFVESAPGWPIRECMADESSYWVGVMRERSANAAPDTRGTDDKVDLLQ
jgi:hypothetical protein